MSERHVTPSGIVVEFRQHDFTPGFAAYLHQEGKPFPDGKAFCALDLSAFLQAHAETGETPAHLAESLADTMVHEVIHVIEAWAGVEFSEARVERLIGAYRRHAETAYEGEDRGMDFSSALYLARAEGRRIRRRAWNEWRYVEMRVGHASEFLADWEGVPWDAASEDMLGDDWEAVEPPVEPAAPTSRTRDADLPAVGSFA